MTKRLKPGAFFDDNEQRAEVDIVELGGTVLVRSMTTAEQDEYEVRLASNRFTDGYRAWMAYHCTINEDGSPFFAREEDGKPVPKERIIHELAQNPWGILMQITDKIAEISAPALDFGALKKNSTVDPAETFSD